MMGAMSNRRHFTQSEREYWLAQFEKHQSTATSFCRQHDLCYQTFLRCNRPGDPLGLISSRRRIVS